MAQKKLQCPHCPRGFGLLHKLSETKNFLVVCDIHPLVEGHILVIPKAHISCMGAMDGKLFSEYDSLYQKAFSFLQKTYGSAAAFEHGVIGQTVFHAHAHFLPFKGSVENIVPEKDALKKIAELADVRKEFAKSGRYMFVALNRELFLVDAELGFPGFFRERFANALGACERADWKNAGNNTELTNLFENDVRKLKRNWTSYLSKSA